MNNVARYVVNIEPGRVAVALAHPDFADLLTEQLLSGFKACFTSIRTRGQQPAAVRFTIEVTGKPT